MKTALVTGANRGIGFEIAKQLGVAGFKVFLGARNETAGKAAVEKLKQENLNVHFLKIDVADKAGIFAAAEEFGKEAETLEVLINNAGIMLDKGNILETSTEFLEKTLGTNTFAPIYVIQAFHKYLRSGSRIVNMSSGLGALSSMGNSTPAYSISKTALNAVTRQFAAVLQEQGIAINSVCPGWVKTDMGGKGAPREISKGAETPVWLATEAPITLTGKYLRDKKEIAW
jgi:NAD(P)-dependent dehydrogenase (short-subunit alcohol dehydrogenase family)